MMASPLTLFFRFKVWVFLLPLAIGLMSAFFSYGERRAYQLIQSEGVTVEGMLLGKDHRNERTTAQGEGTDNYSAHYGYTVSGVEYEGYHAVSEDLFLKLEVDAPVTVHYAFSDPRVSSIEPGIGRGISIWTTVVALIFLLFAYGLFRWRWKIFRSGLRAIEDPAPRQVKVEDHVAGGVSVGSTHYKALTWRSLRNRPTRSRPQGRRMANGSFDQFRALRDRYPLHCHKLLQRDQTADP